MAELSEADIDRILCEAEARLAAAREQPSKAIAVSLRKIPGTGAEKKPQTACRNHKGQASSDISIRIPQIATKKKEPPKDAGSDWYHLPKTELTDDLKRDLQVIRMRDVLALGKQYFKKDTKRKLVPDYCAVGKIIEGPTDGYHGRLTRKERKRTIVEEVLAGEGLGKFKNKYEAIQDRKKSGKKAHYKRVVANRRRNG